MRPLVPRLSHVNELQGMPPHNSPCCWSRSTCMTALMKPMLVHMSSSMLSRLMSKPLARQPRCLYWLISSPCPLNRSRRSNLLGIGPAMMAMYRKIAKRAYGTPAACKRPTEVGLMPQSMKGVASRCTPHRLCNCMDAKSNITTSAHQVGNKPFEASVDNNKASHRISESKPRLCAEQRAYHNWLDDKTFSAEAR